MKLEENVKKLREIYGAAHLVLHQESVSPSKEMTEIKDQVNALEMTLQELLGFREDVETPFHFILPMIKTIGGLLRFLNHLFL